MFEILTVCTGNVCRSPLAEQLLRDRLAAYAPAVGSAGTRTRAGMPMTDEAIRLSVGLGVPPDEPATHRSRPVAERDLQSPDLILTMTRDHRREIAELAPTRLRSTFTIREFARLAAAISDDELRAAADAAEQDPSSRLRAVAAVVASHRGIVVPPADPSDDDVIDPMGRSWAVYQTSAAQLVPAVDAVARVVLIAVKDAA